MKITLVALGSRGDVQPLLALAVRLAQTDRHQVRFAAPDDFEALVAGYGLEFVPLGLSTRRLLTGGSSAEGIETGRNTLVWVAQLLRTMRPMFEQLMDNTVSACRGADAVVFSMMGFGAYHAAEQLGVPCYWAIPFPAMARTRFLPVRAFPALGLGRINLLLNLLSEQFLQLLTGRFLNRWRAGVGLAAIPLGRRPYSRVPILYSFSAHVIPKPADWDEHIHLCGYWFLDQASDWQPPIDLVDFLATGSPPVYIGFGSMAHQNPARISRLVQDALALANRRGVLAIGWGGLAATEPLADHPDIFVLESAPHAWLFPQMAAVVHHGGSGTTGAGLRAGIPQVLVPHIGDQLLWARQVAELGVGPAPIPFRRLTAKRLAAAINRAVNDTDMRHRASALGKDIRAEDGPGRAIEIIERGIKSPS